MGESTGRSKKWGTTMGAIVIMAVCFAFGPAAISAASSVTPLDRAGYNLVQGEDGRLWTRSEWEASPAGDKVVRAFGYMVTTGERAATVWVEYGGNDIATRATVILAEPVAVREFGRYFPELHALMTAADSEAVLISAYPRDQAGIVIRPDADQRLFVRLLPETRQSPTRLNTHSLIRAFIVTELAPAEQQMLTAASTARDITTITDGGWRKVENFFRPELHFSEKLVARRLTDTIVVHHTKLKNMTVASIHDLHLRNGWAGIGYHKVVLPDGSVADGRPERTVGAHAIGVNRRSIGVVAVGDFDTALPSSPQLAALIEVTVALAKKYNVSAERILPHRGVFKDTTCPGLLFPWADFTAAVRAKLSNQTLAPITEGRISPVKPE